MSGFAEKSIFSKQRLRWLLGALALSAVLFVWFSWSYWQLRATIATGFGARIACGCRYIEGRDLPSCTGDFNGLEGMGLVRITDDPALKSVTASVPLLARRTARFKPGFGCFPDKFE